MSERSDALKACAAALCAESILLDRLVREHFVDHEDLACARDILRSLSLSLDTLAVALATSEA